MAAMVPDAPIWGGSQNKRIIASATGAAAASRNGRNLPHRVAVRSTIRPAMRSETPPQTEAPRMIEPAVAVGIPTTSVKYTSTNEETVMK